MFDCYVLYLIIINNDVCIFYFLELYYVLEVNDILNLSYFFNLYVKLFGVFFLILLFLILNLWGYWFNFESIINIIVY